jgi:predicted esterase
MQESPDPGWTPTLPDEVVINSDRVNYVRNQEGLPPCTPQMMRDAYEAATDDVSEAVSFVRASAVRFGIDTRRVALAGFSAGATAALNAVYAQRVPVAAAVSLSGRIQLDMAKRHITGSSEEPPLLMFVGEKDLPSQLESLIAPVEHIKSVGLAHQIVHIPGATHFYPRTVEVPTQKGDSTALECFMAEFLHRSLHLAEWL